MISMTPRKHIPLSLTLLTPTVAIFLTLAVGAGIFGILGFSHLFNPLLAEFALHLVSLVYLGKAYVLPASKTLLAAHKELPINGITLLLPLVFKRLHG